MIDNWNLTCQPNSFLNSGSLPAERAAKYTPKHLGFVKTLAYQIASWKSFFGILSLYKVGGRSVGQFAQGDDQCMHSLYEMFIKISFTLDLEMSQFLMQLVTWSCWIHFFGCNKRPAQWILQMQTTSHLEFQRVSLTRWFLKLLCCSDVLCSMRIHLSLNLQQNTNWQQLIEISPCFQD